MQINAPSGLGAGTPAGIRATPAFSGIDPHQGAPARVPYDGDRRDADTPMEGKRRFLGHGLPAPLGPAVGHVAGVLAPLAVPTLVNRALARPIEDGLTEFLRQRVLAVRVTDLGVEWRFTLDHDSDRIGYTRAEPEATIRGDSLALLLLAARRVDPDTLFFRRRLGVEGDTELGLQAKNLLDTLEDGDLPPPLARFLDHAARVTERWS